MLLLTLADNASEQHVALAQIVGALAAAGKDNRVEVAVDHLGKRRVGSDGHAVRAIHFERVSDCGDDDLHAAAAQDVYD